MTRHTMYQNGKIRNAAGRLVAFWDSAEKVVHVDGHALPLPAQDETEAMEIVGALVK